MKLLYTLLISLTLFGLISNVIAQSNDLLIVTKFNYLPGQCNNDGSNSDEYCPADSISGNIQIKLGNCIPFNGNYVTFELTPVDELVNKTVYGDFDQSCTGPVLSSTIYQQGKCEFNCDNQYDNMPIMFSASSSDFITIPSNSFIDVSYSGLCNNTWKDDFVMIKSYLINTCINQNTGNSINTCINQNTGNSIQYTYHSPSTYLTFQSFTSLNCIPPFTNENINLGEICNEDYNDYIFIQG